MNPGHLQDMDGYAKHPGDKLATQEIFHKSKNEGAEKPGVASSVNNQLFESLPVNQEHSEIRPVAQYSDNEYKPDSKAKRSSKSEMGSKRSSKKEEKLELKVPEADQPQLYDSGDESPELRERQSAEIVYQGKALSEAGNQGKPLHQ